MIDVKHQVNAVRRTMGTRTLEAGEARVLTISQAYDTTVDDLWDAVTSPERIPRWFLPVSGDLVEGGRFQLQGHAGGTVTRCDKPNGFASTWEYGDQTSWIDVRVTADEDGRSRVELEHVAHVADDLWDQFGPGAVGIGWDSMLLGIAQHLRPGGAVVDPSNAMEWLGSDEGREFLRSTADAWAEADIAAGGDPAKARAAADGSFKAYTGG